VAQRINALSVFSKRLKEARARKGLSQKQLGIVAGLDRFVASTRINRYELGVHQPDALTAQRLAHALGVPMAFLFAADDRLARLIVAFGTLPAKVQERVVRDLERMCVHQLGKDRRRYLSVRHSR